MLVLVKRLLPLSTLKNIWMKWFGLQRGSHLLFPLHKGIIEDVITLYDEMHTWKVCFALCQCYVSITITFDLWMSKVAFDAFALVINFLTLDWESKHVIISLFEAKGITRIASFVWGVQVN